MIIKMCVAVCAGIWAYIVTLLSWLVIDIYSAIWYIISRKRGKTIMHKENIFDLFNKQHPAPAEDPTPGDVVKATDVEPDIVKPEEKPEDKPAEEKPEDKPAEEKPEDKPAEEKPED